MAITSSIDLAARIVRLNYAGEVSPQEWRAVMEAVCREPTFEPGFGILVDRRQVEAPTSECVREVLNIIETHRRTLAACPWAVVVGSNAAFFMGRKLEMLARHGAIRIKAFRDISTAERWLRDSRVAKAQES